MRSATVEGGATTSMSPTENSAGAVARRLFDQVRERDHRHGVHLSLAPGLEQQRYAGRHAGEHLVVGRTERSAVERGVA